jgi:erythromycin esterase
MSWRQGLALVLGILAVGVVRTLFAPRSIAGSRGAQSQTPVATDTLDLGFERAPAPSLGVAMGWFLSSSGYRVAVDSIEPYAGKRSLRIGSTATTSASAPGTAVFALPPAAFIGKRLRLRGFIRTNDVRSGSARIWLRVDGRSSLLALSNLGDSAVAGTTQWLDRSVTITVDSSAVEILGGVFLDGRGTAWFDQLSLEVDGKPLDLQLAAAPASEATVAWTRRNAIPIQIADNGDNTDDLRRYDSLFAGARVVGLGEGTHGTREFFQLKERFVKYLGAERGFGVFAIEANMPEARLVNAYVLGGPGDAKSLLAGLGFWTWRTPELLDLLTWMRAYNVSGRGRIEFWGFDAQSPSMAMDSVEAFVRRIEPAYADNVRSAYANARRAWRVHSSGDQRADLAAWRVGADTVLRHLLSYRESYLRAGADSLAVAWAIQESRVVAQGSASAMSRGASRDADMAANVEWILAHSPSGTKMVIWAHNGHVAKTMSAMGAILSRDLGTAYRAVGLATGDGEYAAYGPSGRQVFPLDSPPANSVEKVFRRIDIASFGLDFRSVSTNRDASWFIDEHPFRSIGSVPSSHQFYPTAVARAFDALFYIDRSRASTSLR